ncbi:MAG: hypothetical protein DMD52_02565 [Gemmatimonadetes bacterium]|nr:MAG: hypothetical protein DMD52_02565 [Gemmatimonadota bacterium]
MRHRGGVSSAHRAAPARISPARPVGRHAVAAAAQAGILAGRARRQIRGPRGTRRHPVHVSGDRADDRDATRSARVPGPTRAVVRVGDARARFRPTASGAPRRSGTAGEELPRDLGARPVCPAGPTDGVARVTVRYLRHPELRFTAVEGEGVVLHLRTRRYFTVSESGLAVLEALAAPRTLEELVPVVLNRYEVTPERAEQSVRDFLERCLTADLLAVERVG